MFGKSVPVGIHTEQHMLPFLVFLDGINQSNVDKTMELFLDKVEEIIDYDKWFCGHYHTEKEIDKLEFMFENIKMF